MSSLKLGISGRLAQAFQASQITPLLAVVGLLMGLFAIIITPKEEEPQIDVTMADIFVPYSGASAAEVENLIATPLEQVVSEIEGVEHVYSASRPGMAVVTVQFAVGEKRKDVLVRLYNQIYSHMDWLPANLGAGPPLIKAKGIDDVPVMSITLWSDKPEVSAYDLQQVAHNLEVELKRIAGTRDIYTIGGPDRVVHVEFDPILLANYGLDLDTLRAALQSSNIAGPQSKITEDNHLIVLQAGDFLSTVQEVSDLVVGVSQQGPIILRDVAKVSYGADVSERSAFMGFGPASEQAQPRGALYPAVTLAIAKQSGQNAVVITRAVEAQLAALKNIAIPESVHVTVTRNYGETAQDKANKLISKLLFATVAVIFLVLISMGWREAIIVGAAVTITLLITLFASWAWGFTINRVSLFALIFSIGILVDDAIVVVENIHRHIALGNRNLLEVIPQAVEEVGGPTILATFTVIAALMPMAFVSGLMGPYMSPIPINASAGMFISLLVAFIITPWLAYHLLGRVATPHHSAQPASETTLYRLFQTLLRPFLRSDEGRRWRWGMLAGVLALMVMAVSLPYFQWVVLKMLPLDNKSEFQVVVNMPEGTPVEQTQHALVALAEYIETVPEVLDYQLYAGTASPINFNGLVRQYYLRRDPHQADMQVNLLDKHHRDRSSHAIALAVRGPLQAIGQKYQANVKVVEVPPGPPVLSPIVAEVYGPDHARQVESARALRAMLEAMPDIVDVDDTLEAPVEKRLYRVDRQKAALMGVPHQSIVNAITAAVNGEDVTYLHEDTLKYAMPVRLELNEADKRDPATLGQLRLRSRNGALVPLSEVVQLERSSSEQTLFHKDLLPVVYVTADMAGELDSPLYGMFEVSGQLERQGLYGRPVSQYLTAQPVLALVDTVKWDGEWRITYETFRDMGIAYAVGIILIYLLVVGQFRSYGVPLVIMAPIPLTVIGIFPGHTLLGTQFTATSMIGMMALAGIIVRNSILLVDFVNQQVAQGMDFEEAVIRSGAVRAKPILLTALAATSGAFFILDDPIFSGLAVSLISGIAVSTALTLVVIPVLYYAFFRRHP